MHVILHATQTTLKPTLGLCTECLLAAVQYAEDGITTKACDCFACAG